MRDGHLDALRLVEEHAPRQGNRVGHVRVSVAQDGVLVAEGSAVHNIHRRRPEP